MTVGLDRVMDAARDLGIDANMRAVPSLALGTNEVSLLDLTGAYASVRAGRAEIQPWGIAAIGPDTGPLSTIRHPTKPNKPMAHQEELIELMQGVIDHGTGRGAALPGFAAGKTGTSSRIIATLGLSGLQISSLSECGLAMTIIRPWIASPVEPCRLKSGRHSCLKRCG